MGGKNCKCNDAVILCPLHDSFCKKWRVKLELHIFYHPHGGNRKRLGGVIKKERLIALCSCKYCKYCQFLSIKLSPTFIRYYFTMPCRRIEGSLIQNTKTKRTFCTFGSNSFLGGSWKFLLNFFKNIFNRSIYIMIMTMIFWCYVLKISKMVF